MTFRLRSGAVAADGLVTVELDDEQVEQLVLQALPDPNRPGAGEMGSELEEEHAPDVPGEDWMIEQVGWGVLVPDIDHPPPEALALIEARTRKVGLGWKVPLFSPVDGEHDRLRSSIGGTFRIGSGRGIGDRRIPRHLVVMAHPKQIPWTTQAWIGSLGVAVGRLDPDMEGIDNYIRAVADRWRNAPADPDKASTWSVTSDGMTRVMDAALTQPLAAALRTAKFDVESSSTGNARDLLAQLAGSPAFIATTSHGSLPWEHDPEGTLGRLFDQGGTAIDNSQIADAAPGGALWLLQACCSGGTALPSLFEPLFADDPKDATLAKLRKAARAAPLIAPLPTALLGAASPARGVICQVELTFDLMYADLDGRDEVTPESPTIVTGLTDGIVMAMRMRRAIGSSLADHHADGNANYRQRDLEKGRYQDDTDHDADSPHVWKSFVHDLIARNREATVLLGDPAASFA